MSQTPKKRPACASLSRHQAEAALAHRRQDLADMSVHDLHRLVHRLARRQRELERQNEALRRTQRELEAARNHYADLYDFAPVGYLRLDANGVIQEANRIATQLLGMARSRLLRRRLTDFVAPEPEAQDAMYLHRQQVFAEATTQSCNLWMQRQNGTLFYGQVQSLARDEEGCDQPYWRLALIDLTVLRQQTETQLRRLARHQQHLQEQARAAIAREIHDEVAQTLTSLQLDIAWLAGRNVTNHAAHDRLQVMAAQVDALDRAVHRIAMELRPGLLDDLGLLAAFEWQLEETLQRTGLTFTLQVPPQETPLDIDRSTALFRIFQEAVTNVVRHAQASHITVQVGQTPKAVCLTVCDNGIGIPPARLHTPNALGLLGMRERAQLWGGTITITSQPGSGTTVAVRMPYQATAVLEGLL